MKLRIRKKYVTSERRKYHRLAIWASTALSISLVLGHSLYTTGDLSHVLKSTPLLVGSLIIFYFSTKLFLRFITEYEITSPINNDFRFFGSSILSFFIVWLIIFICWLPCYISYFPGIFSYDVYIQIQQALGNVGYFTHQPPIHTLLFEICIRTARLFGNETNGLIIYAISQMLFMSFCFSIAIYYMAKVNVHYIIRLIALAFFALNPMHALFSFATTKDVIFGGLLLLLMILLIDMVRQPDEYFGYRKYWRLIMSLALLILLCLFRNNAVYALILSIPFVVFTFRSYLIKASGFCAIFLICFHLITGPGYSFLDITPSGISESLSVPFQQLARVASKHSENLKDSDYEAINEIITYNVYDSRIADPVKATFQKKVFTGNPSKYISAYLSAFRQYPNEYITAFLDLNRPFWYPAFENPEWHSKYGYIITDIYKFDFFEIKRNESVFPKLFNFYEGFASGKVTQKYYPILSLFFSVALPIWMFLLTLLILLAKNETRLILVLLPAIFYWLTLMAGPIATLRYIYPLIICYPLLIILILQSKTLISE